MYQWTYNTLHLLYLAHTLAVTGIVCLGVRLLISPADKSPPAFSCQHLMILFNILIISNAKERHQIKYKVYLHNFYTQIITIIKQEPCIHG